MAIRARLSPPQEFRQEWHYHKVKSASLPASMVFAGDRRMEAETFLADGFSTRLRIQQKTGGWAQLSEVAEVWQPNRLKGTLVSSEHGKPFLSATQVFELRPQPRKWLAVEKIADAAAFLVAPRTILVTRSGTVGRATVALQNLQGKIVSDDLLRVLPRNDTDWGWLYAYFRSRSIIQVMQAAHYGHVVKHLEISHMNGLPIVDVDQETKDNFFEKVQRIFDNRNLADKLTEKYEDILSNGFGIGNTKKKDEVFSTVPASEMFLGRRRLEGAFHAPQIRALLEKVHANSLRVDRLGDIVDRVWWMTRFSRNFGDDGVPYMSADELFSISQIGVKRVFTEPVPNYRDFSSKRVGY